MMVGKGAVRGMANEIDAVIKDIDLVVQADIDKVLVLIDSELNSCGRELGTAQKLLLQIPQLMNRLAQQVGPDAPVHIKNSLSSITGEVNAKIETIVENIVEVQKNIKDVDKHTDKIDELTDKIDKLTDVIDNITDKYQG
jgi:SMC interacting uncharacterized protein involved in chromosome segregation